MKTQDTPKARELLRLALEHPTTMGKDVYIREALTWLTKTVTKKRVVLNETDQSFIERVEDFLAQNPDSNLQDGEIATRCGANTASAQGRVSQIRNGVLVSKRNRTLKVAA